MGDQGSWNNLGETSILFHKSYKAFILDFISLAGFLISTIFFLLKDLYNGVLLSGSI